MAVSCGSTSVHNMPPTNFSTWQFSMTAATLPSQLSMSTWWHQFMYVLQNAAAGEEALATPVRWRHSRTDPGRHWCTSFVSLPSLVCSTILLPSMSTLAHPPSARQDYYTPVPNVIWAPNAYNAVQQSYLCHYTHTHTHTHYKALPNVSDLDRAIVKLALTDTKLPSNGNCDTSFTKTDKLK